MEKKRKKPSRETLEFNDYLLNGDFETLGFITIDDVNALCNGKKTEAGFQRLAQFNDSLIKDAKYLGIAYQWRTLKRTGLEADYQNIRTEIENNRLMVLGGLDALSHGVPTEETLQKKYNVLRKQSKAVAALNLTSLTKIEASMERMRQHRELEYGLNDF